MIAKMLINKGRDEKRMNEILTANPLSAIKTLARQLTAKMFSGVGAEALIDRERFQMI
jgi:hypothetical protein